MFKYIYILRIYIDIKMESAHEIHSRYLEKLLRNLPEIDEDPTNVCSVIKEPTWYHHGTKQQRSLCDAFLLFEDNSFMPIELKYSSNLRQKGTSQILQGYEYGLQNLRRPFIRPGKLVFYDTPFQYEEVEIPDCYKGRSLQEIFKTMYG